MMAFLKFTSFTQVCCRHNMKDIDVNVILKRRRQQLFAFPKNALYANSVSHIHYHELHYERIFNNFRNIQIPEPFTIYPWLRDVMQMHAVSTIFNSNRLAVRHSIAISRALQTNLLIIFTLLVHLVCHQNIDENRYTYAYTTRDREREREILPQALLNIPKIAAHFLLALDGFMTQRKNQIRAANFMFSNLWTVLQQSSVSPFSPTKARSQMYIYTSSTNYYQRLFEA